MGAKIRSAGAAVRGPRDSRPAPAASSGGSMPRGPAMRSKRSSAHGSGSGSSISRSVSSSASALAETAASNRRPGRTRPTPPTSHTSRAARPSSSRSAPTPAGTSAASRPDRGGGHEETGDVRERRIPRVDDAHAALGAAAPQLVHRIGARDAHGDRREVDAFGQRVVDRVGPADDRDDLVVFEEGQRRRETVRGAVGVEQPFAPRVPRRPDRARRGCARTPTTVHRARDDARGRGGTPRPGSRARTRTPRAHPRLPLRARGRRRSGVSRHATARPASRHSTR